MNGNYNGPMPMHGDQPNYASAPGQWPASPGMPASWAMQAPPPGPQAPQPGMPIQAKSYSAYPIGYTQPPPIVYNVPTSPHMHPVLNPEIPEYNGYHGGMIYPPPYPPNTVYHENPVADGVTYGPPPTVLAPSSYEIPSIEDLLAPVRELLPDYLPDDWTSASSSGLRTDPVWAPTLEEIIKFGDILSAIPPLPASIPETLPGRRESIILPMLRSLHSFSDDGMGPLNPGDLASVPWQVPKPVLEPVPKPRPKPESYAAAVKMPKRNM